jgi:hypothetical protein
LVGVYLEEYSMNEPLEADYPDDQSIVRMLSEGYFSELGFVMSCWHQNVPCLKERKYTSYNTFSLNCEI